MMEQNDKFKMCIMILDICCLTTCTILNVQIAIQKEQLQIGQQMENKVRQIEEEASESIEILVRNNKSLTDSADQITRERQVFREEYERTLQKKENAQKEYVKLKSSYEKMLYLDTIILELDQENKSQDYMERYFEIDKGSLEEVLEGSQWEDEFDAKFYDLEEWGELLPVGDQVWNRYVIDSSPDSFPVGVLIQNPLIDIGYKDARAGMNLVDIEETYPESKEENKKLSDGRFRYLQYEDENYRYYYVAVDNCPDCTILYVTHR